jgi:alpha-glucosidase
VKKQAEIPEGGEPPTPEVHRWWERGVIYQIYPRSFQDSNGDGVGDLPGILRRLDHLSWLGVDAIWLSPIFPSPMADFGYDISDYTSVHPIFGTLADFDALLEAVHARGLKLLLDFVPNHTSDRHPWFEASRSSRSDPKRDWYIWRDPPKGGGPPTNWLAAFGGSAWTFDPRTGQYYLHSFLPEQPDLNWRNPEVVEAMHAVLRFWLDRGVDGFRIDALANAIKDDLFRDNPPNPVPRPDQGPHSALLPVYTLDRPEVLLLVAGLRRVVNGYPDRVLIGEIYLPVERLVAYYGIEGSGVHLPFNFQLIKLPWNAEVLARAIQNYEALLTSGAWPNWVLGNHDKPRIKSRVGDRQARVAAMLLLTLRGTPTLYYADEIGLADVPIPRERVQDPFERNVPGLGLGRDPARTPMQWGPGPHAEFSTVEPWLPLSADRAEVNVAVERSDPRSILWLHRRLLHLRRSEPALAGGSFTILPAAEDVLAYRRDAEGAGFLIALNLGPKPRAYPLEGLGGPVVLSTHLDRADEVRGELTLRGDEGVVVKLTG